MTEHDTTGPRVTLIPLTDRERRQIAACLEMFSAFQQVADEPDVAYRLRSLRLKVAGDVLMEDGGS